ncbi:MAG: 3'-5' exonuclease, partial [Bacteroidota bacterium]
MYRKELYTKKTGGELPQLVVAENENMQSRYLVQKILELREQGIALEDMAVLFRSSFHSFDLEIELTKANIPFVKFGGFKFIETAHVKDMIAYLRVLENPRD